MRRIIDWWNNRSWVSKQKLFLKTGTRYYGDGGTIHDCSYVDVETKDGKVVAVWFRCQNLPFKQCEVTDQRAESMKKYYTVNPISELRGVEIKDNAINK